MKILEINKFNYLRRGAEKHYLDVVALLRARGHEVAVFSMEHPQNDFSPWKKYFVSYAGFAADDSWRAKLKGVLRIYSWEAKSKIQKLLEDFQPEVVHIHNIYHHISPSILSEIKKRQIPIIMTVHDYNLISPNYSLVSNGKNWEDLQENKFWKFVSGKYFKNSYLQSLLAYAEYAFNQHFNFYGKYIDHYIAPSQFVKGKLMAGGLPSEKIVVLPHFSATDYTGATCNLRNRERFAFYFGSISKEKGLETLVEIFQNLPEVNLYLAGNIEDGFRLPSAKNIKHLGFLNRTEIEKYVRDALFVVTPSRLPETFGLVALEAISNGRPVICFDAGAFGEIIEDNKSGFLCQSEAEMAEKIKLLAGDDGLRILFSRNALLRAKDFESGQYYEKLTQLFAGLKNEKNI